MTRFDGSCRYVHGFVHGDMHPGNILVRRHAQPSNASWDAPRAAAAAAAPSAAAAAAGAAAAPEQAQGAAAAAAAASGRSTGCPPRSTPFELVLLDHGHYVTLPEPLRHKYCQLWCAFVLNDLVTADRVATEMAGPRGTSLLPSALTRSRSQPAAPGSEASNEASLQHGLQSLGNLAAILNEFPPEIVEVLRLTQLVRHMTQQLGVGVADRLRVNVKFALRGLAVKRERGAEALTKAQSSAMWREWQLSWQLATRINLLRALMWYRSVARYLICYWYALYRSPAAIS